MGNPERLTLWSLIILLALSDVVVGWNGRQAYNRWQTCKVDLTNATAEFNRSRGHTIAEALEELYAR